MWTYYGVVGVVIFLMIKVDVVRSFECEVGWTLFEGSCYKAYTPEAVCKDFDAYIVTISNPNENEFVRNTPNYYNSTTPSDSRRIGLSLDVKNELKYTWQNGEKEEFTNWEFDQPDNDEYVHMSIQTGLWRTNYYNGRLPICEKPSGPSGCDVDWEHFEDSCYKAPNSAEICSSVHSHLISINSELENDFANILGDTSNRGASYRIGLTIEQGESEPFSWQDGYEITYTNWENDKMKEQKMTKVVYMTTGSGQGRWNIKRDYFNPICEKRALNARPPVINCPTSAMTYTTKTFDGLTASVDYDLPVVMDNSKEKLVATCFPTPGSHFKLGETTIHCSAMDAYGHNGECTFTAVVEAATMDHSDNETTTDPPIISCPTNQMRFLSNSSDGTQVFYYPATYMYAEKEQLAPCSPASGSYFEVGSTTVTCLVKDPFERTDSCSFIVSVEQEVLPCPPGHHANANPQASTNTGDSSNAYTIVGVVCGVCLLIIIIVIIVAVKVVKRKTSYNPANVVMATGNLYNETSIEPVSSTMAFDSMRADQQMNNHDTEDLPPAPDKPTSSFNP